MEWETASLVLLVTACNFITGIIFSFVFAVVENNAALGSTKNEHFL
jgi:hypothetical protein